MVGAREEVVDAASCSVSVINGDVDVLLQLRVRLPVESALPEC